MDHAAVTWGIAPIGWRNDDLPELGAENTLERVLDDIVTSGFAGTEVGGFFPSADELNTQLQARDLRIAAQWFSSYLVRDGLDAVAAEFRRTCEYLQAVGARRVVVSEQTRSVQQLPENVFGTRPSLDDAEWEVLARGLEALGEIAVEHGLVLVYHHHMGTVVQTAEETARLMAATDPARVSLLFDTGHIHVSDGDVMPLLRAHVDRVRHVHFKDVRADVLAACREKGASFVESFLAGMFTVPGDGAIDFREPYRLLLEHGYRGWIMIEAEQDPAVHDPLEAALTARAYVDGTLRAL